MRNNNVALAEAFYTAMGEKNIGAMENCLHPDIRFIGPLGDMTGKEVYLKTAQGFLNVFNTLTIRTKFGSEDQAVIIYDLDFPEPIGKLPTSALLTFQDDLIKKIEIFFDARPFDKY